MVLTDKSSPLVMVSYTVVIVGGQFIAWLIAPTFYFGLHFAPNIYLAVFFFLFGFIQIFAFIILMEKMK